MKIISPRDAGVAIPVNIGFMLKELGVSRICFDLFVPNATFGHYGRHWE